MTNINFKMKKIYYVFIGVLLLIITNPNVKAFKDYLGYDSYSGLKRTSNFFICSTYRSHSVKYLGVVGNFFRLSHKVPVPPVSIVDSTLKIDSTVMDTSKH